MGEQIFIVWTKMGRGVQVMKGFLINLGFRDSTVVEFSTQISLQPTQAKLFNILRAILKFSFSRYQIFSCFNRHQSAFKAAEVTRATSGCR